MSFQAKEVLACKSELEAKLGLFANDDPAVPMTLEHYEERNIFGVEIIADDASSIVYCPVLVCQKSDSTLTLGLLAIPSQIKGIPVKLLEIPDKAKFS